METDRISYVDYVKAVAIWLVMLSHLVLPGWAAMWINSFHVPLFFFVSGFLFFPDRHPSVRPFVAKKARRLLIPYILIGSVTYVFWLLLLRNHGRQTSFELPWYRPFTAMMAVDVDHMMHNPPLWFFPTLFIVAACGHIMLRKIRLKVLLPLLFVAGWAVYHYVGYTLFVVGQSVVAMLFYALGYAFRNMRARLPLYIGLLMLPVSVCSVWANGWIAMYHNWYSSFPLFVVFAVAGILSVLTLCRILYRWCGENSAVRLVSDNTLALCGFHLTVFALMKGILLYVFGVAPSALDDTFLPNILFSLVALLLCLPLSVVLRRYLPWLVGVDK